jgi:hypothetical protein
MYKEKRRKNYVKIANPGALVKKKIMAKDAFHFFLTMQKIRYERNDNVFSLLLFETHQNSKKQINTFTKIIKTRIRITDAIGWFDNHSLGIFLHAADNPGASFFAVDIIKKTYHTSPAPSYNIYTYPHLWYEKGNSISNKE